MFFKKNLQILATCFLTVNSKKKLQLKSFVWSKVSLKQQQQHRTHQLFLKTPHNFYLLTSICYTINVKKILQTSYSILKGDNFNSLAVQNKNNNIKNPQNLLNLKDFNYKKNVRFNRIIIIIPFFFTNNFFFKNALFVFCTLLFQFFNAKTPTPLENKNNVKALQFDTNTRFTLSRHVLLLNSMFI